MQILIPRPQETLEFKMNKQSEYSSFDNSFDLLEDSVVNGSNKSLQIYYTVFNITEKHNSFLTELDSTT